MATSGGRADIANGNVGAFDSEASSNSIIANKLGGIERRSLVKLVELRMDSMLHSTSLIFTFRIKYQRQMGRWMDKWTGVNERGFDRHSNTKWVRLKQTQRMWWEKGKQKNLTKREKQKKV